MLFLQEPLTASMLAAAPPQEQKQMLGERLFPLIQRMYPDLAGNDIFPGFPSFYRNTVA